MNFIGDEENCLKRHYDCAKLYNPSSVSKIPSDVPFIDPVLIDKVIQVFNSGEFDYVSNLHPPTYPDGMDVAVFSIDTLKDAENKTKDFDAAIKLSKNKEILKDSYENNKNRFREHVILFMKTSGIYSTFCMHPNNDFLKRPELSFTVDTLRDFQFIEKIVKKFKNLNFSLEDIIKVIDKYKIIH